MRESALVLGSITVREGESETEKDTGLTVCLCERERARGRKKGGEQLVWSRVLFSGLFEL